MATRSGQDTTIRFLVYVHVAACAVGAMAAIYVVLIRVPALAGSKLELLYGTLQGAAVGLLFGVAALLVVLIDMVRRTNRSPGLARVGDA